MPAIVSNEVPTTRLDFVSDETAGNPWPLLHEVRELGPVVWHETYRRWIVTTDRAARKVLSNFDRFSVEDTTIVDLFGPETFITMDDRKRHDELRNVWAESFRKNGLDALRPAIEGIVADLLRPVLERLRAGEAVDITHDFCRPVPTMVIARMMGVPNDMLADVVRWSDAMAGGAFTYLSEEEARPQRKRREEAKTALADYLMALLAERRGGSGGDLVSTLARSAPGRRLPPEHLVQNLRQLLFAGNETSAKFLAHIFVTFAEHPDARREIAANRALIGAANDEIMRWQPVVGTLVRRVRGGAIDVAGTQLADGDDLTCLLGAANRDPARYVDPDRFDIHRAPQPSLGFGVGFHNCLGSMLAKMEAEVALDAMLNAVPDFALAAPYRYSSMPLRGPLPVIIAAGGA